MVGYRIMWRSQAGQRKYKPYCMMYNKEKAEAELKKLKEHAGEFEKFKIVEVHYAYNGILDALVELKGGVEVGKI